MIKTRYCTADFLESKKEVIELPIFPFPENELHTKRRPNHYPRGIHLVTSVIILQTQVLDQGKQKSCLYFRMLPVL